MNDEEMRELLIRLDERGERLEDKFDGHVMTTNARLDSHARDLRSLREWRMYLTGGWAVVSAWLGLHVKGHS